MPWGIILFVIPNLFRNLINKFNETLKQVQGDKIKKEAVGVMPDGHVVGVGVVSGKGSADAEDFEFRLPVLANPA